MEAPQVSFRQVVSRGCGLDVHKKVVVATIDGEGIKKQTREFSTVTSSLKELRDWLLEHKVTHVAMESTGVFWKPVYNILEPAGLTVWIVNAAHVKYVPGHKTDKKDSAWLCKLLLAGLLKPSYIPAKEQRELRDLTRYRTTLIQSNASNKNRIIRILEDANIKLSSVLSSTSGAVGTKLINKLCDGMEVTMQDIDEVYHKKLEATKEELYEACQGFVTEHHVYMLQLIRKEINDTEHTIESLNQRIKEVLSSYENALELLKKVPGISAKSVEDLVAEIGLDMSVFPTEKHLASWAGMAPGNNESAGKKKADEQPRETSR
jgi:transposase